MEDTEGRKICRMNYREFRKDTGRRNMYLIRMFPSYPGEQLSDVIPSFEDSGITEERR